MSKNLELIISARTESFEQAMQRMRSEASGTGSYIKQSFEAAGKGADALANAAQDTTGEIGRLGDEAGQSGRELKGSTEAMARALDAVQREAAELRRDLDRVGDSTAEIDQLKRQLEQLESQLKQTGDAADELSFDRALESAERVLSKLQEMSASFLSVAEEGRAMRRAIEQAVPDPKRAEEFTKRAQELKDAFGDLISEEDIGKAVQRIEVLKGGIDDLDRSVALAVSSGKEVEDAAQDLGEILAELSSGNADFDVIGESLRTNFGIAAAALREYGAEIDENGKIVAVTIEQQRKAQQALRDYIDENERFANVATQNKDSQALLSDEFSKFQRTVGGSINEVKEFLAEALLPLFRKLNESPETVKEVTAAFILLLTPLIGLAKAGTAVAGVLGKMGVSAETMTGGIARAREAAAGLSTRLTGAGGAAKTFATGAGGSALALGALAKAAYDAAVASNEHLQSVIDLDEAQTALRETLAAAIRSEEQILQIRKLSTEQIAEEAAKFEEYAQRKIFLTLAIAEATDALTAAEDSGDQAAIKRAQERLQNVFQQRAEQQASHTERMNQIEAEKRAQEQSFQSATDAYNRFKTDFDRGVHESKEAALSSLQAIAEGLDGESQKNALADVRKLQQEILAEKLAALAKAVEAEEVSAEAAKRIQAGLLVTYQANLDQRRQAAERLADAEEKINERRLRNEERLQEQKLELERRAIQQRSNLTADSPELESLERRLAAGEDVVDQIKREAKEQTAKLKGYLEEEAAIERIIIAREQAAAVQADPSNADAIAEQTAEKIRQLNERLAAEQAKLDRELANKRADLEEQRIRIQEKAAKEREAQQKAEAAQESKTAALRVQILEEEIALQESAFQRRRNHLETLAAAGQDVSAQQRQLAEEEAKAEEEAIKKKLELRKQEIRAREAEANIGATAAERELNAKRTALEIEQAQRQAREQLQSIIDADTEKLKAQTAELVKQRDLLKEQNEERKKALGFASTIQGGAQSVEDAFTKNNSGWGVSRAEAAGGSQSQQEIEQQILRNKIRMKENEERAKQTASGSAQPGARPVNVPSGDRSQQPQTSAAEHYAQPPSEPLRLDPSVVGIFQQMLSAIQQTAANTKQAPKPPESIAQNWERATGFTLG